LGQKKGQKEKEGRGGTLKKKRIKTHHSTSSAVASNENIPNLHACIGQLVEGVDGGGLRLRNKPDGIGTTKPGRSSTRKRIGLGLVGPHSRHSQNVLDGMGLDKVISPIGAHAVKSDIAQGAEIAAHNIGDLAVGRQFSEFFGEASQCLGRFDLRRIQVQLGEADAIDVVVELESPFESAGRGFVEFEDASHVSKNLEYGTKKKKAYVGTLAELELVCPGQWSSMSSMSTSRGCHYDQHSVNLTWLRTKKKKKHTSTPFST